MTRKTGWITRISIKGEKVMKPKERSPVLSGVELVSQKRTFMRQRDRDGGEMVSHGRLSSSEK